MNGVDHFLYIELILDRHGSATITLPSNPGTNVDLAQVMSRTG